MPWRERPESLRRGLVARLPPAAWSPDDGSPPHERGTTLVLGGARSGKSAFAEQLARDSALERVYLATATAGDDEMRERIAHHRARRGDGWRTIEEPLALAPRAGARSRRGPRGAGRLPDALAVEPHACGSRRRSGDARARGVACARRGGTVVLVSNEVGLGLVPDTPLGRRFRDAQGRLNQAIAAAADNVVFIAAGLPLWLKRSHREVPP